MACASDLPPELLYRPTGLVVLTGLDLVYNAVHKAIWDSFCNNRRADRLPLQFKPLPGDHEYIKCRPKRTSYEWYIPKGILKTSWMRKHLEQIPAVVVVFFDLDWDDLLWKERQMECATRVEIVRNSLLGRGTKVCMVLIQRNAPLPPGEDVVAGERAASLCAACELSAKLLFVLPLTDHLLGYTIRLENAFYDLAQGYYHNEARKVKSHRDFLNKTTHQFLFVRHQFKIAFYNELKQDSQTALKHYKQAYGHILELRMLDTSLLETKTIAGFISYKICRLSFQHNTPLDAITHFRKLIDFFKGKVGMQDLAFEHSAWMARHFQSFGDLFDEAIRLGLTALQTQHPGIYYQQAAYQSISRKQLCLGLCHASPPAAPPSGAAAPPPPPQTDVLENLVKLDYYGQRPWRQGQLSIEPPDGVKEKEGIQALQMLELKVDHSWIIIPMLGAAVAQFKKYKSPRMKRYLMVQMGEEYYHASDYKKALQLLSRVTCDYRQERWWTLLTSVLSTQLRCAYIVCSVQEYVTICLELIGSYTQITVADKTRIQMNLVRVISGDVPEPEPGCGEQAVDSARTLWNNFSQRPEPVCVAVEMCNIVPFVECKAQFTKETFTADEIIQVKVFLRACAPFPIGFSKLYVQFNNQTYNKHCIVTDDTSAPEGQRTDLYLSPNKVKVHRFSFLPAAEDVHKALEITSIVLELSACPTRLAVLHWVGAGGDAVVAPPTGQKSPFRHRIESTAAATTVGTSTRNEEKAETQWDNVDVNSFTRILSRPSHCEISVKHNAPGLTNERYRFTVSVVNNEQVDIQNVQLLFGLRDNDGILIHQATSVSMSVNPPTDGGGGAATGVRVLTKDLGSMQPLQEISSEFYTLSTITGDLYVLVSVSYDIQVKTSSPSSSSSSPSQGSILCKCYKEQPVVLSVISPLDVNIKLVSLMFEPLETVNADQSFLLMTDILCASPSPISFITSTLELSPDVRFTDDVVVSQLNEVSLNCGDSAGECVSLIVATTATNHAAVQLGRYVVSFRRLDASPESPPITFSVALPTVSVEHVPVYVHVDIPACGSVQSSLPVTYHVYNHTPYLQDIEVLMDSSEAFMFAGYRQIRFHVLPHGEHRLKYNLVPLIPGNVRLPTLHLNMSRYPGTMAAVVQKMLPSTIFVQPRNRASAIIQPGL